MPAFSFLAGNLTDTSGSNLASVINHAAGSGLGFFGSGGLGQSVQVGNYQGSTVVVNDVGTSGAWSAQNIKYVGPLEVSGIISNNNMTGALNTIPNWQATLKIRFSGASAIRTSNVKVWPYDRIASTNWPSSVTVKVAELQHTGVGYGAEKYSTTTGTTSVTATSTAWSTFQKNETTPSGSTPSSSGLYLYASPGTGGTHTSGTGTLSTIHDWYLAISASPDSIGSKTFGLWVELEYTEG